MAKTFLKNLVATVTPPRSTQVFDIPEPERRPHGLPIELFQKILMKAGGLAKEEKSELRKHDEAFTAVSKVCDAYSFNEALKRFRDQLDRAISGEKISTESKLEAIASNAQSRAVLKHRLDLISTEAKLIVRPIYERMIPAAQEMADALEVEEKSYSGADFRPSFRLLQHRVAVQTLNRYVVELDTPKRTRPAHLLFTDKIN